MTVRSWAFATCAIPLLPLTSCGDTGKLEETGIDSSIDDSAMDSSDTDTGEAPIPPPCSDGTWGAITDWKAAIHVSTELGSESGDGSMASPLSRISDALLLARERSDNKRIAIWPGAYSDNVALRLDDSEPSTDSGTVVQGCGVDEVTVTADDPELAVFSVKGAMGVEIAGLSSEGGTRGIEVLTQAQVAITDVRINRASEVGLMVHGGSTKTGSPTRVDLVDVEVHESQTKDGAFGYGFAFQGGSIATMSGGGAYDNHSVGILADDTESLELSAVIVSGTVQDAEGYLGRGIQVQQGATATISGSTLSSNQDAGIFALQAVHLELTGNLVEGTMLSGLPGSKSTSGDGIVMSRGEGNKNPDYYQAALLDNTITGCDRAGMLVDGVTAEISGTTMSGNGLPKYGDTVIVQGPAVVSGSDDVVTPKEDLSINRVALATMPIDE